MRLDANWIRGRFGAALRGTDLYDRLFQPRNVTGPSGLRDAPRPFVLRVRDRSLGAGEPFEFGFHLFDVNAPAAEIEKAFRQFVEIESIEGGEVVRLSLAAQSAARVRVTFLTPTELKWGADPMVRGRSADRPSTDFALLFARIRDRISTLRALYQGGPLEIDFKALGERAAQIRMTRCEIEHVAAERTSRHTGQTHSLGGFTGVAEYEGDLGEFLPYLEIAKWTGVGRQTVWGKGEIACETF